MEMHRAANSLRQHVRTAHRLEPKRNQAGGDCLFRALSQALHGDEEHHLELRNVACDWMALHPESIYNETRHTSDNNSTGSEGSEEPLVHVERVRQQGVYADAAEIKAIHFCLRRSIVIHYSVSHPPIEFKYEGSDESGPPILLLRTNGASRSMCHYELLEPIGVDSEKEKDGNVVAPCEDAQWKIDREHIICHLKDDTSDIHLILSATSSRAQKARHVLMQFAPSHQSKQSRVNSISNLIRDFQSGKGRFDPSKKKNKKPEWKNSKARDLLYKLRLHRFRGTSAMSSEDIYDSHSIFSQYDLNDFKKWDRDMIRLTQKHKQVIDEAIELYHQHRLIHPQVTISCRGKPIWNNHDAKLQLIGDTRSGKAKSMKPKQLHQSSDVYKDFSLDDFRKHIYQEKYRQLAGPYWQQKRNKAAEKKHYADVDEMYREVLL